MVPNDPTAKRELNQAAQMGEVAGRMTRALDGQEIERRVKAVYREVATAPDGEYHFEVGRGLAERLNYTPATLNQMPHESVDSFTGVGYHFDWAAISEGDSVLDLGSGSGMDAFVAALHVGETGGVTGIDMTSAQVAKSRECRDRVNLNVVAFEQGYIEELPFENDTFDVVISNGALNLSTRKEESFREARRVLKPLGRLAISDIVSLEEIPERLKSNAELWAACISGAMELTAYIETIEAAGLEVVVFRENPQYEFRTRMARTMSQTYGLTSISLRARKQD